MNNMKRNNLLADIAEAFYLDGLTQKEIGEKFGFARPSISRMLAEARDSGVVSVEINRLFENDEKLAAHIAKKFDVKNIYVAVLPQQKWKDFENSFGFFAANILYDFLKPHSLLGITLGTTVASVIDGLCRLNPIPIKVVQLCGSISADSPKLDAHAIVENLSRTYGIDAIYFHAPYAVQSQEIRDYLLQNQSNQKSIEWARKTDIALVEAGILNMENSSLFHGHYITADNLNNLKNMGAIGDIGGFNINREGCFIEGGNYWRTGIDFNDFIKIKHRVCVAIGEHKAAQIAAALKGKIITDLIIDQATAKKLLHSLT